MQQDLELAQEEGGREEKRRRILQAALHHFAARGYRGTVIDDIAQDAGTAKGTLYLYFRDKEDLYHRAVLHVLDMLQQRIQAEVGPTMGPEEVLRTVARCQLELFCDHPDYIRLFLAMFAGGTPAIAERLLASLQDRRRQLVDGLLQVMERGKREGTFRRDVESLDAVHAFIGITNQSVQGLFLSPGTSRRSPAQGAEAILRIFLQGVAASCGGMEKKGKEKR